MKEQASFTTSESVIAYIRSTWTSHIWSIEQKAAMICICGYASSHTIYELSAMCLYVYSKKEKHTYVWFHEAIERGIHPAVS